MPSQQVIDAARYERFKTLELTAQAARADMVKDAAIYWAALHEIWSEKLYHDAGYANQELWLKEVCETQNGPSLTVFHQAMKMISAMTQNGAKLETAYLAIASDLTALKYDMGRWFERTGKNTYVLKPDVAGQLQTEYAGDLDVAIQAIAALPAASARSKVSGIHSPNARHLSVVDYGESFGAYLIKIAAVGGEMPTLIYDVVIGVTQGRSPELDAFMRAKFNPMGE